MNIEPILTSPELISSLVSALFFNLYLTLIVMLRYRNQLGYDFIFYSLVVFSLPTIILVSIPVYIILTGSVNGAIKLLFLGALFILYMRIARKIRKKLLG